MTQIQKPTMRHRQLLEKLPDWYHELKDVPRVSSRDALLFILLTGCGWRQVSGLEWKNVDSSSNTIDVGLPDDQTLIPIVPTMAPILERCAMEQRVNEGSFLFCSRLRGKPLSNNLKSYRQALDGSRSKLSIGDLRTIFQTVALLEGYSPDFLAQESIEIAEKRIMLATIQRKILTLCRPAAGDGFLSIVKAHRRSQKQGVG